MKETVIALLTGLLLATHGALWGSAAVFAVCILISVIDLIAPASRKS